MAQPVIYTIKSFDAGVGADIPFTYNANQVFGNEMIIYDNDTGTQVYDVKTANSMVLAHTIAANSGLANGKYYACKVCVFDKDGVASAWSELKTFYCFATPTWGFANLTASQIISTGEYTLRLNYTQANSEPLNTWQVMLYDVNKTLLTQSAELYSTDGYTYTVKGLENGTQYFARAIGVTLNGMTLDTGYVPFSASYIVPSSWAYVDLANDKQDGSIRISCNIKIVVGETEGGDPVYIDDSMIDVRGSGKCVKFVDNYVIPSGFSLRLLGKDFANGENIVEMDDGRATVQIKYIEGYFDSFSKTDKCAYLLLRAKQGNMIYTCMSEPAVLPEDKMVYISMRRSKTLWELDFEAQEPEESEA